MSVLTAETEGQGFVAFDFAGSWEPGKILRGWFEDLGNVLACHITGPHFTLAGSLPGLLNLDFVLRLLGCIHLPGQPQVFSSQE